MVNSTSKLSPTPPALSTKSTSQSPFRRGCTASGSSANIARRRFARCMIEIEANMERVDAKVARKLILAGELPDGVAVEGHLDFNHCHDLIALPAGLTVKRLTLDGCQSLAALPERLNC